MAADTKFRLKNKFIYIYILTCFENKFLIYISQNNIIKLWHEKRWVICSLWKIIGLISFSTYFCPIHSSLLCFLILFSCLIQTTLNPFKIKYVSLYVSDFPPLYLMSFLTLSDRWFIRLDFNLVTAEPSQKWGRAETAPKCLI